MNYITSLQAAEKWSISQRRVAVLCAQNRILGAIKAGKTWLIPSDCEKPKDERHEKEFETNADFEYCIASEPSCAYGVKTELMLDPSLVEASKRVFAKNGKTLSEGINEYLKNIIAEHKQDFSSSYPKEFFNLFGSAQNLDVPDNIEDLVPEKVEL